MITQLTEQYPRIARAFWWDTLVDGSLFRQWMVGLGRRTALGRIAHLLCELHARLQAVGLCENDTYAFPVTQTELGDALRKIVRRRVDAFVDVRQAERLERRSMHHRAERVVDRRAR